MSNKIFITAFFDYYRSIGKNKQDDWMDRIGNLKFIFYTKNPVIF